MITLPGLSAEAITETLVFGVAPIAMVSAMARAIYEMAVETPQRFASENVLLRVLSFPVIGLSLVAMYFWFLAPASLLMEWYPETVPDLALAITAVPLQFTDSLWGMGQDTPMPRSWLASATTFHLAAEVLHWLLGIPARRRAEMRYKAAEDALGQPAPKGKEEKSSILKRGY